MLKRHEDWELNGEYRFDSLIDHCDTLSRLFLIEKLLREQIRLLRKIAGEEE